MADGPAEKARFCSQCGNPVVVANANFCKHCGSPLAGLQVIAHNLSWRPMIAAGLSVIPGLGHVYKGRPWSGAAWFVAILFAYHLGQLLGFVLHFVCAGNAALAGALREDALFARFSGRRSTSARRAPR